jgi:hypothetical protein
MLLGSNDSHRQYVHLRSKLRDADREKLAESRQSRVIGHNLAVYLALPLQLAGIRCGPVHYYPCPGLQPCYSRPLAFIVSPPLEGVNDTVLNGSGTGKSLAVLNSQG